MCTAIQEEPADMKIETSGDPETSVMLSYHHCSRLQNAPISGVTETASSDSMQSVTWIRVKSQNVTTVLFQKVFGNPDPRNCFERAIRPLFHYKNNIKIMFPVHFPEIKPII
jgi:hypothetical protein